MHLFAIIFFRYLADLVKAELSIEASPVAGQSCGGEIIMIDGDEVAPMSIFPRGGLESKKKVFLR